jgi:hypothetical protein
MDKKIKDVMDYAKEVLEAVTRTIHHEYLGDTSIAESHDIEEYTFGLQRAIDALEADPPRTFDFGVTEDREDTLARMVEEGQLANVMDALAEVCHARASECESRWDDVAAASRWKGAAGECEELAEQTDFPWMIHPTSPVRLI